MTRHWNDSRTNDDWPRCGSWNQNEDTLVVSALESDCQDCRNAEGIGPPEQKGCAVKKTLDYEQQPPLTTPDGKIVERIK